MTSRISVIIPNHNGSRTIGRCLEAVFASKFDAYEVVVVDDCSDDGSLDIIGKFPCRLVKLPARSGASKARNEGARQSRGETLFFIDADCMVHEDTLAKVYNAMDRKENTVIGGTYTPLPGDRDFFSTFQSVFINYFETKKKEPDYIASHAMAIKRDLFMDQRGFPEIFLPIIEDVSFSHTLRKAGVRLVMDPDIVVTHIFNFSFIKSIRNAFRKSSYWTIYSIKNRDLARDSGTASLELKFNVMSFGLLLMLAPALSLARMGVAALLVTALVLALNMTINRRLLASMRRTKGTAFGLAASLYYVLIYPLPVGLGGLTGLASYLLKYRTGGF
ncbi:MAG: glycosyltransferase [Nitrospirae bacterium]|nr:glycosyltransferase [Nitrospirota bacterium]